MLIQYALRNKKAVLTVINQTTENDKYCMKPQRQSVSCQVSDSREAYI